MRSAIPSSTITDNYISGSCPSLTAAAQAGSGKGSSVAGLVRDRGEKKRHLVAEG